MPTITLDEIEITTILAALRLFRLATSIPADTPREQAIEILTVTAMQLTTSETGEPLVLLDPAQIDDLLDRLIRP